MIISITSDDIRLGKKFDCKSCPISRAVKRAITLPNHSVLKITHGSIQIDSLTTGCFSWWEDILSPADMRKVQDFIGHYDKRRVESWEREGYLQPFEFDLPVDRLLNQLQESAA